MITIRPYGGLANRMRSIASAVYLAKAINQQLFVVWICSKELNCIFNSLFEESKHFTFTNDPKLSALLYPHCFTDKITYISLIERLGKLFYSSYFFGSSNISSEIYNKLRSDKSIYLTTCHEIGPKFPLSELFTPSQSIRKIVNSQMESIDDNCVGVHIRRTDHINAIKASPLSIFIQKMEDLIDNDSSIIFFLATDSLETESILKKRFGNRINTRSKTLDRNSTLGIQDALVDMFCLSNTKAILGSFESSFSTIAAELTNIPLYTLKED